MPSMVPGNFNTPQAYWHYVTLKLQRHERVAPWRDQYQYLRAYYWNNGLYDVVRKALTGMGVEKQDTKSIRNPVYRVVEFYASKLWPGTLSRALPIQTDNEAIEGPIKQIWQWSNWGTEKQTFARWFPMMGDAFLKVNAEVREDNSARVFMQNIDPEYVTEFQPDERGFLLSIRLDIPQTEIDGETIRNYTRTEIWDKTGWRIYEHEERDITPEERLPPPIESGFLSSLGVDFVPFVWQPFRAVGDERGANAFIAQLDKIDEANRQATRLSAMLFRHNRALWALQANAVDNAGRPLPAPRISTDSNDDTLEVEDDEIFRLPGNSTLAPLVAPINYADALSVLNAQMEELREDMPELAYYRLREHGVTSGRAARILLDDAYERGVEARGMAEAALVRADQMALTLGQNLGLFQGLGTYESGALDHEFRERPILPVDEFEDAQTVQTYVGAGVPLAPSLKRAGWTDEEVDEVRDEVAQDREEQARLDQEALNAARQRFNQDTATNGTQARQGDEGTQTGVR